MRYKLVIFDFDGTLADSFPFFLSTINTLAKMYRFREVDTESVDLLRQYDAKRVLKHLGVPLWKVPAVTRSFAKEMSGKTSEIPLFEGVEDMLCQLSEEGLLLSLITSNSRENVNQILGPGSMELMTSPQCGTSLFGKSVKLKNILKKTGIAPKSAMYIGDELRDLQAAQSVKMDSGAVSWGYTSVDALAKYSPTFVFNDVGDITTKLLQQGEPGQ